MFATATSSKLNRVKDFGADVVINYKAEDFAKVVNVQTDERGVDVIIDFVGAPYFAQNFASLAKGGRLVQVGILGGGGDVKLPIEQLLYRHVQILGTVMKSRSPEEKFAMVQRFIQRWLASFESSGGLRPVVDSTYPLAYAAEAHRHMEGSANVGKIILTM